MGFSVLGFSVPVFVIGYCLIYVFAIKLDWLPVQGYQRIGDGFGGFLQRLILPSLTLVGHLHRADRPHHARQRARGAERGLHPHRARQGPVERRSLLQPRAAQRRGADRHRDRHRHRPADRRRGRHRERVQASPASAASPSKRCWRATIPTIQAVILLFSLVYVLINLLSTSPTRCSIRGSAIEREPALLVDPADRRRRRPSAGLWALALRNSGVIVRRRRHRSSCC